MLKLLKDIYEHKYKALMIIPFVLLLLAFVQIGMQYYTTGDFIHRGVTLKGGSTITIIKTTIDTNDLENFLQDRFPKADISVRTITAAGKVVNIAVDSDAQEIEEINSLLSAIIQKESLNKEDYSVEVMGTSLGQSFFKQTITAIIAAFVLMAIVVLIYFRKVVPAFAVVLCAFSDITVSLAIFNLTGIKLSTAGVAAFLMLIGYSVDSDMVLSTRMLRRKEGSVMDRIYSSIKTGLTMTVTTLVAITVALIFVQSDVIKQIMIILLIGLLVDIVMTYVQNVGVIRLYLDWVEKKNKRKTENFTE